MPVFSPINANPGKVHYTQYVRAENKPDEKVAEPVTPPTPESPTTT